MLNLDKIYELLRIALITGAINSLFIQKIKCKFISNDCILVIFSLISSIVIGTLFSLTFSNLNLISSLWVGLFTFIHAEAIFNILKKATVIKSVKEDDNGEG